MTTYPLTGDGFAALSRADGSTVVHSEDHGRIIGTPVNAKRYLKGDNTTESATALGELETAAVNHRVVWPKGIYALPRTYNVTGPQMHQGEGPHPNGTAISASGYVFSLAADVGNVVLEDMYLFPNAGTTTGGAVLVPGTGAIHSGLRFNRLVGDGTNAKTTLTTPIFYVENVIGMHMQDVSASNGPVGIWVAPGSGFANSNSFVRLRSTSTATQSFSGYPAATGAVIGSAATSVCDSIFESCTGHGLVFPDNYGTVRDCWFENNGDTSLVIPDGSSGVQVLASKFHYQFVGNAAAVHISIGSGGHHMVAGNIFQDGSNSGCNVNIAAGSDNNIFIGNKNLGGPVDLGSWFYTDAGTNSVFLATDTVDDSVLSWSSAGLIRGFGSGQPAILLGNNLATDYVNSPNGQVYLYSKVSGGKVKLCARFPSGAVQTIASEP